MPYVFLQGKKTWSKEADQALQAADKRLHQLYNIAVCWESGWVSPWAALDSPPEAGPASLQGCDTSLVPVPECVPYVRSSGLLSDHLV